MSNKFRLTLASLIAAVLVVLSAIAVAPATATAASAAIAEGDADYVQQWRKAVDAYQAEDYREALDVWTQMAQRPEWLSADLYYNLGNTWRMLGRDGNAAWMYEKALALNPRAADAHANLRLLRADHPEPASQPIFISRALAWLTFRFTVGEWTGLVAAFYAVAALAGAAWVFLRGRRGRAMAGLFAVAATVATFVAASFLVPRWVDGEHRQYAVVIQPDAVVRSAPGRDDAESAYFEALEGERFQVREAGFAGWMRVKNPQDGRVGYLPESALGLI